MRFYAKIAKVDAEKRMVWGYASTTAEDADGETITLGAMTGALDDYMRFANIREMHQLSAVGVATEANVDDRGLYLGAKIVDQDAWQKVVEGVYKGFSVGGKATARDPANRKTITGLRLSEISLVDRPCNPEAVFDCWKAADAPPLTGDTLLTTQNNTAMADALVAAFVAGQEIPKPTAEEIAKAANGAPVDGKDVKIPAGGDPVEAVTPKDSGENTIDKPVAGKDVSIDPDGKEVEVIPPGTSGEDVKEKPVDGKRPADMIPSGNGDPVQIVNPDGEVVKIADDLDKADEAGEADPIVKRKFTATQRREAAKSGAAMKDGSYPIENKEDLKNAIQALGRAKDRDATIRHIKRRAKALGLEDELPAFMGGKKKADEPETVMVERHVPAQLWSCGDPAHQHVAKAEAIHCVDQREGLAKAAAAVKPAADAVALLRDAVGAALVVAGKDAEIAKAKPEEVKKGLYTLSDLACMMLQLRSMVCNVDYEETAEGDDASRLPQLMRDALKSLVEAFRAMSDEETNELMESVATNTAEPNASATFLYLAAHGGDIFKAGARHSKADMDRIQKAHDVLKDLGAVCMAADDEADKVAKALNEKEAEVSELRKVLDQVEPLTKAVSELGATITDLRKTAEAQSEEIAKLKAQPMPPKTAASPHAVGKAEDVTGLAEDEASLLDRISKMTDEERGVMLAKAALRNPRAAHFANAT